MNIYQEPYYELGNLCILHAFFVFILANPIGFSGGVPMSHRNWKIKVTELLNGRARISTQSFRMNCFLYFI